MTRKIIVVPTVTSYLMISFQKEEAENFFFMIVVVPVKNAPAVAS